MSAVVTRIGALDMQVCVPADWSDQQVISFAESQYPCGTMVGWQIRTDEKLLAGAPSRNPCASLGDHVHVTLDA